MTWKEFVKAAEEAGVQPEDEIWYIDISFPDEIHVERSGMDPTELVIS